MKKTWVACLAAGLIAITGLLIANAVNSGNICMATEKTLKQVVQRGPIYIDGNDNFASQAANEEWVGNGSAENPYIIENYDINASTANGIEIRNTSAYFVIRNCVIHDGKSNYKCGIYFYNVTSGKIENVADYNNYHGIYLCSSSNNNIISACTIYNNSWAGIYLYSSSNNNTICACNIYNNFWTGVYLSSSSNNNISACTIYNNSDDGIWLYSFSNNNIISECNVYNNSDDGIYLWDSSNNNQITNCNVYNNSYGIRLSSSSNNNITSCTVYNNSYGVSVYSSLNNQIIDCAIYNNSYGIRTSSAENTSIESCMILNSTNVGVDISYLTTYIINSSIAGSGTKDVFLHNSTTSTIVKCINTTFTTVFVDENSTLIRSWYLDVNVTDIYNNTVPYASVRVKDAHNNYIGDFSTGMSGVAQNIPCVAYTQNSTGKDYSMNNHTATVGNSTSSVNISANKKVTIKAWYFSIFGIIAEDLTYQNYTIIQENNLTIAENGALTLKNVILKMNCTYNGSHYIEVLSGAEMYILNNSNITSTDPNNHYLFWVRNGSKFEMRDSELSECGYEWGENGDHSGLWINTNNVTLDNNILSNNFYGVSFFSSSDGQITNCDIYSNSQYGIYSSSSNNQITNCTIYNNSMGVYLFSSSNNSIIKCTCYNNTDFGIYFRFSSNNNISNNWIHNNDIGIYLLDDSSNNTVSNCNVYNNSYGIELFSSSNNNITNCAVYNNYYYGIYLWYSSNNNQITNCAVYNNYYYGIYLDTSSNYIINSTVTNSSNYDFYLAQNSQLTSLNTTFNKTKVSITDNSTLTVSWYLNVIVLWNNSVPAEGANVGVRDFNCTFDFINTTTNELGWVRNIVVQEYTQNQTNTTYFIPYNVNASQGAFWGLTSIPITATRALVLYLNQPFPHNAPEIKDVSPTSLYSIKENITTEFKFNISHPDNLTLTYHWYLDDIEVKNGTLENTSTVQGLDFTYYFNYTSSGEHKIKITISDGNAIVSRTWIMAVINLNAPPMITNWEPGWDSMSITEEQNVSFGITAVDVDGDALSYWWYIYYENITVPVEEYGGVNGTNTIIFGHFDTTGNYTVEIKVNETYNASSNTSHTWLLKVWNVTELNLLIAELQQQIDTMSSTIANLTSNITELNANISSLQAQLDNLTALYNNLSGQISNLTSERDNALNDKSIAENRTALAEKEKDEAVNAKHLAEYKLGASVVGAVIAGVFAGAFVFSLLLKKRKGSK